jgi:hypothetical protein
VSLVVFLLELQESHELVGADRGAHDEALHLVTALG